jgi:hypothetical protein
VKASLLGAGLTIPITDGRFHLGTWQGIWLCEHRDHPCAFHLSHRLRDKAKAPAGLTWVFFHVCVVCVCVCRVCWHHTATRNIVVTIQGMKQDS